tara:strand:+ start:29 stop:361 length:333 start_codon:yes stop_codon:yes gene_type:complete
MRLVYVAGPYTRGNMCENIGVAARAGLEIMQAGHAPFVPHTHTHVMALFEYRDYEEWMAIDFAVVERCDAVFRLPGISDGADREVTLAEKCGIPVFTVMEDLIEYLGHSD